jgi:precorrin-4 C11-methyltransferase
VNAIVSKIEKIAGGRRGEGNPTAEAVSPRLGRVTFVGAGPGAADLLTLRGAKVIAEADVVVWASSLVHPDVVGHARPDADVVDSAALPLEGVAAVYRRAADEGLHVARVHSGDPALWGAIAEQLQLCAELGLATAIVPGVSSFTAAAAAVQRELTVPEVAQSVILTRLGGGKTPMPPGEDVAEFARHGTTMALFLSAARSAQLQQELLDGGYPLDTPCVVAYRVSWPDELIVQCPLAELAAAVKAHRLWKHTLVLVGPALSAADGGGTRSHLYHPGHFHGFRRAEPAARAALRAHDASLIDRQSTALQVPRSAVDCWGELDAGAAGDGAVPG